MDRFEQVEQFCYLGNILNAKGDNIKATIRARVQKGWQNWRALTPILLQKTMSLKMKGWMYSLAVRSAMLYGAETWPMTKEDVKLLERTEMRMLRWMAGVSRSERRTNQTIRTAFGVQPISLVVRQHRLRWFGHIERNMENQICRAIEVEGTKPVGRPKTTWSQVIERDMRELGLRRQDAQDRTRWRSKISGEGAHPWRLRERRSIN